MKFGLCTSLDNLKLTSNMGYDYIEPAVAGIAAMEEDDFLKAVENVKNSPIKCEVCNILFRPGIHLTSSEYDEEEIKAYLDRAFSRIVQLGTHTVVFGSGGARRVPPEVDLARARKQFLRAAGVVGEMAAKYNLIIALEPLNKKETNLINTVREGIELVRELNHPNVKLLADFYHMRMENEPMSILEEAGDILFHLHIAKGVDRTYPRSSAEDIYGEFFKVLKKIGYNKGISVEGRTENIDEDGSAALKVLKELAASV